ncbi:MAG: carbamoyltransferase HypF [Pirellulales bacterium]|nr:carbamoyltransferase HypF [Pirellulales bacterium]
MIECDLQPRLPVEAGSTCNLPAAAVRLVLRGCVQGVGLRPWLVRLAREHGLAGRVFNSPLGAVAEVCGSDAAVRDFACRVRALREGWPGLASVECSALEPWVDRSLVILASDGATAPQTAIPLDRATCATCLREITEQSARRAGDPFVSCVDCGPRYSVLAALPYERSRTSLQSFVLCESCRREYLSIDDRRFHAETIGCPRCGPRLVCRRAGKSAVLHTSAQAIAAAAAALVQGQIVALLGLGGYQLLVDACRADSVERLRKLKRRPAKPLAVMFADVAAAERCVQLDDAERRVLTSGANPIVVVRQRPLAPIAAAVTQGLPTLGIFLPTTALHRLLLAAVDRPLVVTSGNREGDPIVFHPAQAPAEIDPLADLVLEHDRPILRPIDDSVVQVIAGRQMVLRAGRGLAPVSLELPEGPALLAVGGQQKVAVALAGSRQAYLGPHLGDLDTPSMRQRFAEQVVALEQLAGVAPAAIVHDLHPDYFSTRWAAQQPAPTIAVQHHHAHVAAALADLNRGADEVAGAVWDGTGWGTDGTVWGGELLCARCDGFRRVASVRLFPLWGGELAVRQPWRVAAALLADALGPAAAQAWPFSPAARDGVQALLRMSSRTRDRLLSSSVGRLFDAVACLVLGHETSAYEGEAAVRLEAAAAGSGQRGAGPYSWAWEADGELVRWDWRPLVHEIVSEVQRGVAPGQVAMRFHRTLAEMLLTAVEHCSGLPLVLSGGVFQNRLLVELIIERAAESGVEVTWPCRTPINDGGLALGQLAVARAQTCGAAAMQRERG